MNDSEMLELQIEISGSDREEWAAALKTTNPSELSVASKRHLTGAEPILLAVLKLATAAVPLVIQLLKDRKVRRLRIGNKVIENPSDEDIERVFSSQEK